MSCLHRHEGWGLSLGAQRGVLVLCWNNRSWDECHDLDPIPLYQRCREVYPCGKYRGFYWMIDKGEALNFALAHEEADAPRPPAMPLQEREEKVVLLAQGGLRFRDVQLRILEFVGLA